MLGLDLVWEKMTTKDKDRLCATYNKLSNFMWEINNRFTNQSDILSYKDKSLREKFIELGYSVMRAISDQLDEK